MKHRFLFFSILFISFTSLSMGVTVFSEQREILKEWQKQKKDFSVLIDDDQVSVHGNFDFQLPPEEAEDLINEFNIVELPATLEYQRGEIFSLAQGRYAHDPDILLPYMTDDPYGPDHNPAYNVFVGNMSYREEAENEAKMIQLMGKRSAKSSRHRSKFNVRLDQFASIHELSKTVSNFHFPYYVKRQ